MRLGTGRLVSVVSLFFLLGGCTPDDTSRCRSGYKYLEGDCWWEEDLESSSSNEPIHTDTHEIPSGLGDACASSDDCAEKEASFCALDPSKPGSPGACTIPDCADGTNPCPENLGWVCCKFANIVGHPSICVPQSSYDSMGDFLGC